MTVAHNDDVMPAEWQGGGNGKQYGSLPGDFYGDSWDGTVYGAIKFNIDPANGQVTLDRNFGTEGDGRMKFEPFSDGNLVVGSTGIDVWKGRLYYPIYDRGRDEPAHANVGIQDAATGDVIDVLDLSEWLVVDVGEGNQAFSPHDIWVDDTGIYVVGYAGSQHVKITLDGELKWLNDNGDGFADRRNADTGEFDYGAFSITPWNTSGSGSKDGWGFAFIPLLGSTTSTVDILGPDGTGILHMVATHAPGPLAAMGSSPLKRTVRTTGFTGTLVRGAAVGQTPGTCPTLRDFRLVRRSTSPLTLRPRLSIPIPVRP